MRLVNFRSVTIRTKLSKKMLISELYISLPWKKSLKIKLQDVYEHLDFDLVIQHFKLCLFVNEGDKRRLLGAVLA